MFSLTRKLLQMTTTIAWQSLLECWYVNVHMPLGCQSPLALTFIILQCKVVVICCLSCQTEGKLVTTRRLIFVDSTYSLNYLVGDEKKKWLTSLYTLVCIKYKMNIAMTKMRKISHTIVMSRSCLWLLKYSSKFGMGFSILTFETKLDISLNSSLIDGFKKGEQNGSFESAKWLREKWI